MPIKTCKLLYKQNARPYKLKRNLYVTFQSYDRSREFHKETTDGGISFKFKGHRYILIQSTAVRWRD